MMSCKKIAGWLEHSENSRLDDGFLEHAEDLEKLNVVVWAPSSIA